MEKVELAVSVMEQRVETDAAMSSTSTIPSRMFGSVCNLEHIGNNVVLNRLFERSYFVGSKESVAERADEISSSRNEQGEKCGYNYAALCLLVVFMPKYFCIICGSPHVPKLVMRTVAMSDAAALTPSLGSPCAE